MSTELIIELSQRTIETVLLLSAPVLIAACAISLIVNIVQVLTSIQDATIATVPRLAVVAGTLLLLAPWMLRRLVSFTLQLFSDFHPYVS